jgi:hypothetical protein
MKEQTMHTRSREEHVINSRRCRLVPFPVTSEGTFDLPEGAVLVAVDFRSEGGLGSRRTPATAWAAVTVGKHHDASPDVASARP